MKEGIIEKFISWIFGTKEERWKCDVCGHYIDDKRRRLKCLLYDENSRCCNVCSKCEIPIDKVDNRMYIIDGGSIQPANNNAVKFESERAGQKGSLWKVKK